MKHWRNSWERKLGERLRGARATPKDHVWDLIEDELDTTSNKRPGYRRYTAVLLLLLLIPAGYFGLQRSPSGEMSSPFPSLTLESNFDLYHPGLPALAGADIADVAAFADIPTTIVHDHTTVQVNELPAGDAIPSIEVEVLDEPTVATAELLPLKALHREQYKSQEIVHLNEIQQGHLIPNEHRTHKRLDISMYDGLVQPYEPTALRPVVDIISESTFRINPNNAIVTALIARPDLQPIVYDMSEELETPELGLPAISDLILDLPAIENDVITPDVEVRIEGKDMVSQLPLVSSVLRTHEIAGELIVPVLDIQEVRDQSELVSLVAQQQFIMKGMFLMSSSLIADINPDLIPKPIEVAPDDEWLTEARDEFNSWKDVLEEDESDEELDELIEEAILDEDDPWTKRQNERQDLFYTYNVNMGFHIGAIAGVQQTWVTRASRNAQIDRSVTEYKFNPGFQAGVNVGYDFSNHFGLMAEVKYSDEGGKYYNTKKERIEQMDLKYLEIPVYLKVKHSKLTSKDRPIVFNYLLGMKFSDLRKVSMISGDIEDRRFGQDYNTSDWGLTAGMDFDLYINKNLFWTIGARAGISGMGGSSDYQEDVKGPMNIDAGIFTRFSYRIPGKK